MKYISYDLTVYKERIKSFGCICTIECVSNIRNLVYKNSYITLVEKPLSQMVHLKGRSFV